MKKKLFSFSLLLSSLFGFSQIIFNRAYQNVDEHSNRFLVEIYGDLYFTSQNYDVSAFGNCYLYKHDSQGQLKFRSSILSGNEVTAFFKSIDNKLIVSGKNIMCDVIPSTQTNFLTKLDTNGTAVFTSTYTMKHGEDPIAVVQLNDSGFVSFTDSVMIKHNKSGQFISSINLGISNMSAAILLQNGNFLVSGKLLGNNSLIELSTNGTIVNSKPFTTHLIKFQFYNAQQLLALGGNKKLYKLSPSMELISQSAFTNNTEVNDFTFFHDSIFTITSDLVTASKYLICDTSFNSLFLSNTITNNFEQTAIHVSLSQVDFLATGKAAVGKLAGTTMLTVPHSFVSLTKLNKHASHNFENDIQLISVEVDSLYTTSYTFSTPPLMVCTSYVRAKVKIKNNGNRLLHNFQLNKFERFPYDCGATYFQEEFTNLNVAPGDSVTLTSSKFASHYLDLVSIGSTVPMVECFYISLPNGETDRLFEDNEVCKSIQVLITSLNEKNTDPVFVRLGPVPFSDELNIESDSEIYRLKIMNALGQVIQLEEAIGKKGTLNLNNLKNGIYYVHIETEKGVVTKKMLKN